MELTGDPDKVFSYNTKQQVNIQDRWLGFANTFLQLATLGYIVVGVFIVGEGYLEIEEARGTVATHVRGDAYAFSSDKPGARYFSPEELTYPGLENGNIFISTRQKIHHQKRGLCEDHMMPCESDKDCSIAVQGTCGDKGFCKEESWCNQGSPEAYALEVANLNIWVKSAIQFISIAPEKVYSTETGHPYPEIGYNVFTVRDLLMKCEPVPVRYEEISELGVAVEVQFLWNCDVSKEACRPEVRARRLDVLFDKNNIGFAFAYPEYISDDERMLHEVQGVRMYIRSSGSGYQISMTALIMKASTTSALLSLAPIIADLLMLKVFKLRKKFFARKYEVSQDFSEYFDEMEARKKEEEENPIDYEDDDRKHQAAEEEWHKKLHEED